MGRRRDFTDAQIEEALRKSGGVQNQAAIALEEASRKAGTNKRCSRWKLHYWVKKNKKFRVICDELTEIRLDIAETQAFKLIDEGDGSMIRFFLATKGKHRGYGKELRVSTSDSQIMEALREGLLDPTKMTNDELENLIKLQEEALAVLESRDRAAAIVYSVDRRGSATG
jgi:hypothetical protein